jgi:hypothetical protein
MKVSELKEMLKKYEDTDSVIVALWDKDCFKALNTEERLVTDKEWNVTADEFVMQFHDQMLGAKIREQLEIVMKQEDLATEIFIENFMAQYQSGTTEEQLWDKE